MSEYQYYEFQAVDRPLSMEQMAELRELSTRATITPTRMVNVYHWGSFKGDPLKLMEQYFDAFVYVANWGTRQFMLRLPRRLLDPKTTSLYATDDLMDVHLAGDSIILELGTENEDGETWVEDEDSEGWMPSLLPLRAELAGGDVRVLYLGWLAGVQEDMLDEDAIEPPVPPGLGSLSASLQALTEFLGIGEDLLAVAAARSPAIPDGPSPGDLERWIVSLPVSEKDAWLVRLATGNGANLRAELLRRFREQHAPSPGTHAGGRTAAELLAAAEGMAEVRRRREAEQKAAERTRRAREEAAARETYLESLVGREEDLWRHADVLVAMKQAKDYDRAVQVLTDLRDLAVRQQQSEAFSARLAPLREKFARLPSFIQRLERAGLRG